MSTLLRRGSSTFLLAVAALLLSQPGSAQAHPHLIGRWMAPVPPGGLMVYDFGPAVYLGNGLWRGPFTFTVSNCPAAMGTYELRMFSGTEGTISFKDNPGGFISVGNVDLGTRIMVYKNTTYRP